MDYKYDIFISYSRNDNVAIGTELCWVETFHEDLENWLTKRRGLSELKIWRDTSSMRPSDLINDSIEDAVRQTKLLFALNSSNYLNSKYCTMERELFQKYNRDSKRPLVVENSYRIFNILINDIPHQEWIEKLGHTSGFVMFDKNGKDPIARSDGRYLKQLGKIVEAVEEILEKFSKPAQQTEQPEISSVKIFVAGVAPSLNEFRERIITEAKTKRAVVLDDIADDLSFETYQKATENELARADFSVHLLDQYPGRQIHDQELSYPAAQCEIALGVKKPQLIWAPAELNIQAIEEKQQKDFLDKIANGDRAPIRYKFIQSTKTEFIEILTQEIDKLWRTSTNGVSPTEAEEDRKRAEAEKKRKADNPPRIFISYSHNDRTHATRLESELKSAGAEVYVDYKGTRPGESFPERIEKALEWCDTLILLWTKEAKESRWVKLEWHYALEEEKRIIPCMVDGTKLSPLLRTTQYFDFREIDSGMSQLFEALELTPEDPT